MEIMKTGINNFAGFSTKELGGRKAEEKEQMPQDVVVKSESAEIPPIITEIAKTEKKSVSDKLRKTGGALALIAAFCPLILGAVGCAGPVSPNTPPRQESQKERVVEKKAVETATEKKEEKQLSPEDMELKRLEIEQKKLEVAEKQAKIEQQRLEIEQRREKIEQMKRGYKVGKAVGEATGDLINQILR